MTVDDWRALVAELVSIDDAMVSGTQHVSNQGQALDGFSALAHFRDVAKRARVALAEPEPQRPTVMEIIELADEIEEAELGQVDLVRAALARWGNPSGATPISVSDRLPEEKDCMVHPRTKLGNWCWGFERCEVSLARPAKWRLMHMETIELEASHWLPHYALSIPQDTEQP